MAFKIATNVASINTQRWLGVAQVGMNKALERLSSGYKINRAADDAAGIAIATKLNVKAVSVAKAIDNGNQAIAMLQTAESGIDQIAAILTRLKELATQAASDNVADKDREALDQERTQLEAEINKIANNTQYGSTKLIFGARTLENTGSSLTPANGISNIDVSNASITGDYTLSVTVNGENVELTLAAPGGGTQKVTVTKPEGFSTTVVNFNAYGIKVTINSAIGDIGGNNGFTVGGGSAPSFTFQLGSSNDQNDQIDVSLSDMTTSSLHLSGDIKTRGAAQNYMDLVESAIDYVNTARATIGAAQNQITYHIANLEAMYENTRAAVSTIKDADFAREMAEFTKYQIITQSGIAMLAQANQLPQLILSLMR